jgi:hypothetical protein
LNLELESNCNLLYGYLVIRLRNASQPQNHVDVVPRAAERLSEKERLDGH